MRNFFLFHIMRLRIRDGIIYGLSIIIIKIEFRGRFMAQRIEVGLELSGQDAIDFLNNIKNPTFTLRGMKIMREAYELAKSREKQRSGEPFSRATEE
jgi:predicted DNA-binding helix-hairpin-helix protein